MNFFLVKQYISFGILIMTFDQSVLQGELLSEWNFLALQFMIVLLSWNFMF